jgi:hypothetical protein
MLVEALANLNLYSDEREYAILKLHPRAIVAGAGVIAEVGDPFVALLADKDEVTLIMPADLVEEFSTRLHAPVQAPETYRLIMVDQELPFDLVGFIATLGNALAQANIPIMTYAAFSTDHIFVPTSRFDEAIKTLYTLKTK